MTIKINNLVYSTGDFSMSISDVSVQEGMVTGIIGKNGSGKSTLLKLIAGGLKPERGDVAIDEKPVSRFSVRDLSRKMSFVQQEVSDPISFTVREVLSVSGYSRNQSEPDMKDSLSKFEVEHLIDRKFAELSGGERRLVALACSVYQDAEIMLMDEPTTFLDVDKQLLVDNVIEEMKEKGKTVVLVMHDLGSVYALCDEVILIRDGSLIDAGETESVMSKENLMKTYGVEFDIFDTPSGKDFRGRRPLPYQ